MDFSTRAVSSIMHFYAFSHQKWTLPSLKSASHQGVMMTSFGQNTEMNIEQTDINGHGNDRQH